MIIDKKIKAKFDREIGPLTFALFMRVARTSLDMTQEEMGKKLGITRAHVCDIQKDRHLVSTEFAMKAGLSEQIALQACLQDQVRKAGSEAVVKVS